MSKNDKKTMHAAALGWWASHINADNGAARKTRAQLRRASRPSEVLVVEATHQLDARIRSVDDKIFLTGEHYPLRLAMMATVLAGIDNHSTQSLPSRFGQSNGDRAVLSQLRFQRILSAADDWVLASRLRRALPMVKRSANIAELGSDLIYWGESVQNRWCFRYFGAATPDSLNNKQSTDDIEVAE